METKNMNVRVPLSIYSKVERIAENRKVKQSQVVRMLLELGVQCHEDMETVGLIGVVDFMGYVRQAVRDKFSTKGRQLSLL